MIKSKFRQFVLNHSVLRELFFFFGRRKANVKKIDRALKRGNIKRPEKKAANVIVSLTSYGERIAELKYTLYSLITQTVLPEKIVVNIAFSDEEKITPELRQFESCGVEFYLTEDLRSYKKLIPTVERFPASCIVTADDDLFYKKTWLERLYKTHQKYPGDVCCHLVYKITHDGNKISTYQKWIHNYKARGADRHIFLLGGAGTLYPPKTFHKDILNEDLYMKLAPYADDIWFYFMIVLNKKNIRQIKNPLANLRFVNPYREYGISGGTTLTQKNVGENKNDEQFRAVLAHYKISEQEFIAYIEGNKDNIEIDGS